MVGWSEGAGKIPVLGRPTNLDHSRAGAYCACSRCRWGLFGHFFSHLSILFSFSLSLGDGLIETEILSQRAVKPTTTNQPAYIHTYIHTYSVCQNKNTGYLETTNATEVDKRG